MRNNLRTIGISLAGVLIAIGLFLLLENLRVGSLVCQSQFGPCSQPVQERLNKLRGRSVLEVSGLIKKELSSDRRVSKFSIRYIIPETVMVYIVEKKAEVAMGRQGFDGYVLADSEGYVLSVEKNTSLPVINVASGEDINFIPGAKVSDNLFFAQRIMKYIFALYTVKLAVYYNDRIEVRLNSGPKIIFPKEGDVEVLIGSLSLILSRLNNREGEIRMGEIDLRYKNPIIR